MDVPEDLFLSSSLNSVIAQCFCCSRRRALSILVSSRQLATGVGAAQCRSSNEIMNNDSLGAKRADIIRAMINNDKNGRGLYNR